MLGSIFMSSNAFALDGIEEVKIALSKSQAKQIYLIIGVICNEAGFKERFGDLMNDPNIFVVFGDKEKPAENIPGHCLTGNFNDKKEIEKLAQNFPDTFDVITSDGFGTTKFLNSYDDEIILLLAKSLKDKGRLFYHDQIETRFYNQIPKEEIQGVAVLSVDDINDYKSRLPKILGSGFHILPSLMIPAEFLKNIPVDQEKLDGLSEEVLKLIQDYSPQNFIFTVNKLNNLGLKDAGLMQNRAFKFTKKEELVAPIERALKIAEFNKNVLPGLIEDIKEMVKNNITATLGNNFSQIDVLSLDKVLDNNVLKPKDIGDIKYVVYEFKK